MTAALEGGEWSAAQPSHILPPGKTRYPFYRRLGGPQGRSGRAENLVPTRIRSRTVQLIGSHYTNWATQPTPYNVYYINNNNHDYYFGLCCLEFSECWICFHPGYWERKKVASIRPFIHYQYQQPSPCFAWQGRTEQCICMTLCSCCVYVVSYKAG